MSGSLFEVIPNSHQTYFSTVQIEFMKRDINFSKTGNININLQDKDTRYKIQNCI